MQKSTKRVRKGASRVFDYSNLLRRIKEVFGKQSMFAKAMELSERSVSLKLNNLRDWTQDEMCRCCEVLMLPYTEIPNYFFILNK